MPPTPASAIGPAGRVADNPVQAIGLALFAMASAMGVAHAQSGQELIDLINVYRSEERRCEGVLKDPVGPLASHAGLSKVQIGPDGDLQSALKKQRYLPARVLTIGLSGPTRASAAMAMIEQRYCQPLRDAAFADIGVSREGNQWQIVLARPVLSPELADWQNAGQEVLRLTNQARSQARRCGQASYAAAPPLTWAPPLGQASLAHSRDMAQQNYFRHRASDGSQVSDRVERSGYAWRGVGENIAAGQGSAPQAVSAWLSSPSHCANLMNPRHTQMGAAYAVNADSDSTIYWTQVFATPR